MPDLDLTDSIIAKSDQVNADDLIAGPITVTISKVIKGSPEQPFDFQLVERPGRAYRPSKTMRRVIVEAWGTDATKYAGRRLTLYREPSITFGGQKVGGMGSVPDTAPVNSSGMPGVSTPAGLDSDGLPVGLQAVGRRDDEELVLGCGAVAEANRPWPKFAPLAYS